MCVCLHVRVCACLKERVAQAHVGLEQVQGGVCVCLTLMHEVKARRMLQARRPRASSR